MIDLVVGFLLESSQWEVCIKSTFETLSYLLVMDQKALEKDQPSHYTMMCISADYAENS